MKKNPHAVALGRKGGKVRSEAKTKAARKNAQKPRKALAALALVWLCAGCGNGSPMAPSLPQAETAITRNLPNCTQLTFTETAATYSCTNPGGQPQPVACTIVGNAITCHAVYP